MASRGSAVDVPNAESKIPVRVARTAYEPGSSAIGDWHGGRVSGRGGGMRSTRRRSGRGRATRRSVIRAMGAEPARWAAHDGAAARARGAAARLHSLPGRRTMFGAGRCPPRGTDLEFTPLCSSVRLRAPPATRGVLCVLVAGIRARPSAAVPRLLRGARLTGSVSLA